LSWQQRGKRPGRLHLELDRSAPLLICAVLLYSITPVAGLRAITSRSAGWSILSRAPEYSTYAHLATHFAFRDAARIQGRGTFQPALGGFSGTPFALRLSDYLKVLALQQGPSLIGASLPGALRRERMIMHRGAEQVEIHSGEFS
jgi:hypothetical protein